uniref:Uncharacterized protein n=1 Tax=Rangifer tarandus platyrhynchus TaxID=3082113 RepID=A0ACB0E7Z3_RANTA|nr:unnamed protein product [Rangifer tarandus platyrhynchus]
MGARGPEKRGEKKPNCENPRETERREHWKKRKQKKSFFRTRAGHLGVVGRGTHLGMEELSCEKRPGRPPGGQVQARRHVPGAGAQTKRRKAEEAECRMTGGPPKTAFRVCSSARLPGRAPARAASCTPQSKAAGIPHPTPRVLEFSSSHGCKTVAGPRGEAGVKARGCGAKGCLQEERDCPDCQDCLQGKRKNGAELSKLRTVKCEPPGRRQAGCIRTRRRPPQCSRPRARCASRSTSCAQGTGRVADRRVVAGQVAEAAARLRTLLASVVAQRLMEPAPASGTL